MELQASRRVEHFMKRDGRTLANIDHRSALKIRNRRGQALINQMGQVRIY